MKRYAAVLRVPHVAALIAATLLARFPIGINGLAIVLYLRAERGSFAVAGAVVGALAAGSGIGAPIQGRLVDAFGQRRVLVPLGFVHAGALGALVAGTEAGSPGAVLFACGFLAGFAIPPTSSGARTEAYTWPVTAFVGGIAIGSALAGVIVEATSWRTAFLAAGAIAALGTLVAVARRHTIVEPAAV